MSLAVDDQDGDGLQLDKIGPFISFKLRRIFSGTTQ